MSSELLQRAAALLRPVQDHPIPGILFWDIAPVLRDHEVLAHLVDLMYERWKNERIDVIAGFDARGFIFGPLLAQRLGVPFEQIRKKGKLPGQVISQSYGLEYGKDVLEMINDGFAAGKRFLLIDDVLATGGTAWAGAELVTRLDGVVAGFTGIIELPELAGRAQLLNYPIQSLISVIEGKPYVDVEYCVDMIVLSARLNNVVYIERLSEPYGLALPGGRIEKESLLQAAARELFEETGCDMNTGFAEYHYVLTKTHRDPRGRKVSYVLRVFCDTGVTKSESGKTRVIKAEDFPDSSSFVLGHKEALDHPMEVGSRRSV